MFIFRKGQWHSALYTATKAQIILVPFQSPKPEWQGSTFSSRSLGSGTQGCTASKTRAVLPTGRAASCPSKSQLPEQQQQRKTEAWEAKREAAQLLERDGLSPRAALGRPAPWPAGTGPQPRRRAYPAPSPVWRSPSPEPRVFLPHGSHAPPRPRSQSTPLPRDPQPAHPPAPNQSPRPGWGVSGTWGPGSGLYMLSGHGHVLPVAQAPRSRRWPAHALWVRSSARLLRPKAPEEAPE